MILRVFDPEKGTWVLFLFVAFFGVVVAVNSVFISKAISTHSGVVTDQPYEKGLAYDEILDKAKSQPDIVQRAVFEDGILRWTLKDTNGQAIDADVMARIVRPVSGGQDFEITLSHDKDGVYKADLDLPMKGRWEALLKAQWQSQQYQTRVPIIIE